MREKYESLALTQLKELAKVRGIKGVSAMKKNDVVEAMLALDEKEKTEKEKQDKAEKPAIDEQSVKAEKTHRAESTEKISAYEAVSFFLSSSSTMSCLLKQIMQGSSCSAIIIRKRSSRLKFGAGFAAAKITSAWSTLATAGRMSAFFLGSIFWILPFPASSSSTSISTSSPTRGLVPSLRKMPLALHS